jgi:tRNA(fMet)-specific endonuclease VapC
MSRVLLDTSAYIAATRFHTRMQQFLETSTEVWMSPVVLGELWAGYRKSTRPAENESVLTSFLESVGAHIAAIDEETAVRYAEIHDYLRRAGTPVSPNDLWIAATAMQHGLQLVTTDADFKKIPHVLVEYFPPEAKQA